MATAILTKDILQHILSPSFLLFDISYKSVFLQYATEGFIPLIIYLITDNLGDTIDTFQIVISQFLVSK